MPALIARARRVEAVLSLNSDVFSERLLEVLERRLKAGVVIRCLLIHDHIGWDRRVVRRVHALAQGFPRTFYAQPAGVASEEMFSRCAIQRNGSCIALIPVPPMQPTESPPWTHRAVVVEDAVGAILLDTQQHVDAVIGAGGWVPVEDIDLEALVRFGARADALGRLKRLRRAGGGPGPSGLEILAEFATVMKSDPSGSGLVQQRRQRKRTMQIVRRRMLELIRLHGSGGSKFLQRHDHLLAHHVLTLLGSVSDHPEPTASVSPDALCAGLAALGDPHVIAPDEAFRTLQAHLETPERLTAPLIALLLHTLNPRRFAPVSAVALEGLALGLEDSLTWDQHRTTAPGDYAEHCRRAERLRQALKLADLADLDALLHYASPLLFMHDA
ncbi:hypothetical protein [Xanthomonas sp. NCPPB 2632]|uniref:hypothetical protein n=1 Tax=Xanthomonas sp. NCPPB 2632 TaxID=3240912 RepID=UPI0035150BEC